MNSPLDASTFDKFRGTPEQHPGNMPAATSPTTTVAGTFHFEGFDFPLPTVDPVTGMLSIPELLRILIVALAASNDPRVRSILKAAQIEIPDVHGARFFPRQTD